MIIFSGFVITFVLTFLGDTYAGPVHSNLTESSHCSKNDSISTFPNPTNCAKYYQCENETLVEMTCPSTQHYSRILKTCDDPTYAACNITGSSLTSAFPLLIHHTENRTTTIIPYVTLKAIGINNTETGKNSTEDLYGLKNSTFDASSTQSLFNATTSNFNSSFVTKGIITTSTEALPAENRNHSIPSYIVIKTNRSTSASNNTTATISFETTTLETPNEAKAKNSSLNNSESSLVEKANVTSSKGIIVVENKQNATSAGGETDEKSDESNEEGAEEEDNKNEGQITSQKPKP